MKTRLVDDNSPFQPFTVEVTIETKEELINLVTDFTEALNNDIDFGEMLPLYSMLSNKKDSLLIKKKGVRDMP